MAGVNQLTAAALTFDWRPVANAAVQLVAKSAAQLVANAAVQPAGSARAHHVRKNTIRCF